MERTRPEGTSAGRVLDGRYRLDEQIARGGMATVHRATDLRLDRTVAVKVMHDGLAHDEDFVRRFGREARAAARLSHPGVVAVFDTGDDDGTLYLVMELVRGRTLRQVVREEAPLPPARALRLVEAVLEALGAAHAAGIVHRDVKPENVLVPDDQHDLADHDVPGTRVKVADFGLSRAVSSETQHTATGEVLIGTVSYLSPELVVDGRADARADVYAAGVVLYELLTGHKPHQADSPIQVAYKHVHEDVPAPSARVAGIPDYLDALVARATARAVELRPTDARVMLRQVRQVRIAVEQGVDHDAELTADLTPVALRAAAHDSLDALEETGTNELPEILTARQATRERELVGAGPSSWGGAPYDEADDASRDAGRDAGRDEGRDAGRDADGGESTTVHDRLGEVLLPEQRAAEDRPEPPGPPRRARRERRERRRRSRGPVALLLVLLLAAGAGVGGWWYGIARYTQTPSVLNLTAAAAEAKLGDAGLRLASGEPAFSEQVPAGEVISSDPAPSDRVLDGGTVTITVSKGPERYAVPDLAGRTVDDAQQALMDTRLEPGDQRLRYDEAVPEGQLVRTDPAAGTPLKRDASVDLVVSRGPRPIDVPDLTGQEVEAARAALTEKQLAVTVRDEHSDTVPAGVVIAQTPASGTLFKGQGVELVRSLGPVMVEVPRVVGDGVAAATRKLEAAGFAVRTRRSSVYIGVQYVVSQTPAGGTARKGSTVTLGIV